MANREYTVPQLFKHIETPKIEPNSMQLPGPFKAKSNHQQTLGFPSELIDNWQQNAIDAMGQAVNQSRGLRVFLDSCVKCGACTDKCHYYLGSADPKNMPVARQDLFRNVYRKYHTPAGRFLSKLGLDWLIGGQEMNRSVLDDWYNYYHQCSECRRCTVYCPYGIDTSEITMAARNIMSQIGVGQKYSTEVISKVYQVGNNLGLPEAALQNTLEGLEEDIEEETGIFVKLPLDQVGADILLVAPSADFFAEPHVDGLIGYAKVLHESGISWTFSSKASEAANFGLFIGNEDSMRKIALRIREAAIDLGVKRIIFGECGHAWRVAYNYLETLAGPFDFLDKNHPMPQHICEFTHDLIQRNQLTLDPSRNNDKTVTFHDSCNVARASNMGGISGGQFSIPRDIIKAVCNRYVDMAKDTIHGATFCCGGGGGLLTDDLMEVRVKGALPRMTALNNVVEEQGVTHMAAICAICKSQFSKILPVYGMDMDMIVSLHQLVGTAIILTGQKKTIHQEIENQHRLL
jgi:Fe-S oxidoreductase